MTTHKKILIADTDTESLGTIASRLDARGYTVLRCDTSESVLAAVRTEIPDLILLDAHMESIGGVGLPQAVKHTLRTFFIPIIMMAERDHIAEQIMSVQSGFDDLIIKPFSPLELQLRVEMNLKRATESVQANPLTKLPGNIAIEHTIKERIKSGEQFSVCYLDIDNFKSFNDKYGFDKGDDVITQTSRIILHVVQSFNDEKIFVGHVGGDDFVVIMTPEQEEVFAQACIEEFDRLIPTHYSKEDQQTGNITVTNRRGKQETFPLMTISIAAVTNVFRTFSNAGEIAQTAAEVKKFLKTQSGSVYLRDRREMPMETFAETTRTFYGGRERKKMAEPLGQVLLAAGLISPEQLQEALKRHFASGQRLGHVLIGMHAVSSDRVGHMLEKKLGIPYQSLANLQQASNVERLFTRDYVRMHGVVPLRIDGAELHLAMIDPYDLAIIDDIERMTGYDVVPYIALEEEFTAFIERHYGTEA